MFKTVAIDRPMWYHLRWGVSNMLIRLARRVYPKNPEVRAFWMDLMMDELISGRAITRVDPSELYKDSSST